MDDLKPCPLCGALPCDWVDDPHKAEVGLCWTLAKIREVLGVGEKPMLGELPDIIAATLTAQAAEIARLREALNKANLPEWFYHPDYTESALYSPYEVIEERYDFEPGWHIAEIDCAKSLPAIWCAVHVRTDDEMDALETDDRVVFTEHASREGAEAALTGSQSHD